jgi:hypothetical protein
MTDAQRHRTITVVTTSRLGILMEVGAMLADSLRRSVADASHRTVHDEPPDWRHPVVLVGGGPEFESILVDAPVRSRRAPVVLWELDPLPPPDLPPRAVSARLPLARARLATRQRDHAGRRTHRAVATARKWSLRAVTPPLRPERYGHFIDRAGLEAEAFMRLAWILAAGKSQRLDAVVVTNRDAESSLRGQGVRAFRAPVGAHPWMGRDRHGDRDLDVVFLGIAGTSTRERARRLERLDRELRASGHSLFAQTASCFGEERTRLLNRAKVIVNVRTISWHPELLRFVLAGVNGALVITEEPSRDCDPMIRDSHFLSAARDQLGAVALAALEDDRRRAAIVDQMTELLARDLTMAGFAQRLLQGEFVD